MSNHSSLMTSLVKLINSKHGSIGSHWFLKKMKLDTYISGKVPVPEGDEAKALHKKNLVKAKTIIADSIKDHLIPQVSSLKTPKEMFDSLIKLFEDDSEKTIEECEDPECRDHTVILYKGLSNQRTT